MGKKALFECLVSELTVITELQRRLNPNRVTKLVNEWDFSLVGTLEVAELEVGGKFVWHVTDGQHRWAAAMRINPKTKVSVVIEYDLSEQEVARLFLARNQMIAKVPALDQYEVGLIALDPVSLSVKEALDSNQLVAGTQPTETHVAAIAALMTIIRKGEASEGWTGADLLDEALSSATLIWPTAGGSRYNGDILKALAYLYARNRRGKVDWTRLYGKLEAQTPEQWALQAKAMSSAMSGGGEGRATHILNLFRTTYNHRLGKAKKLA